MLKGKHILHTVYLLWNGTVFRKYYLAKNSDYLFYLSMRHTFTYTAKDNKCSRLQRWVILECKPVKKQSISNK